MNITNRNNKNLWTLTIVGTGLIGISALIFWFNNTSESTACGGYYWYSLENLVFGGVPTLFFVTFSIATYIHSKNTSVYIKMLKSILVALVFAILGYGLSVFVTFGRCGFTF